MTASAARTQLEKALKAAADPTRAVFSARYFKTGKGEYGEGDIFLGITVPVLRKTALKYRNLWLADLKTPLESRFHEYPRRKILVSALGTKSHQTELFREQT